ncbi:TonB-dependent receptor family protein [Chitinophaga pendula]|uniref:outer membrane beta-barrel family protein n=1 Tax=Chitinophaga TaxID=79328 RepID=UPI000BB00A25|nr:MULTISPECIES: outer membrane beta-barrel family protein [Chitinophaga]ASZ12506.1 hypothetical protein CK934_16850 [Chitinophaga sp. MD30]UCJ09890.1 TonB-dependent receptor family protein [Chitinophaga pendula]
MPEMLIRYVILCLIFLLPVNISAQQHTSAPIPSATTGRVDTIGTYVLSGKIVDKEGKTIPDASLLLFRLADSTLLKTAISNTNGAFQFPDLKNETLLLKISHLAYKDTVMTIHHISNAQYLRIILDTQRSTELNGVTVTSRKPLIERKIDRTVLNVENSVSLAGSSALDALKKAPGVRVSGETSIDIIGKSNVQVMINNRLIQVSAADLMNILKAMPASDLDRIEVITNPPAQYDAAGNAGLINIVTKKNRVAGASGSIQGTYRQAVFPSFDGGGTFNYLQGKWSMMATANAGKQLNYGVGGNDISYPTARWKNEADHVTSSRQFNGSLSIDRELNSRQLIGIKYTATNGWTTTTSGTDTRIFNAGKSSPDSLIATNNYTPVDTRSQDVNFYFEHKFDSTGKRLTAAADYFFYDKGLDQTFTSYNYFPQGVKTGDSSLARSRAGQIIQVYTGQIDVVLPFKWMEMSFGGKATFIDNSSYTDYYQVANGNAYYDSSRSNAFDYTEKTQALYFSTSKRWNKWEFQAGLRGEFTQTKGMSVTYQQTTNNSYFRLFPTLYMLYRQQEDQVYGFSYGRRISRPGYARLNPFRWYASPFSYVEGNPFLQPAYSNNFELKYDYKDLLSSQLYLNIRNNGFDQIGIPDPITKITGVVQRNFLQGYSYGIIESLNLMPVDWLESYNQVQVYHNLTLSSDPNTQSSIGGWSAYLSSDNTITCNKQGTLLANVSCWYQFPEVDGVDRVGAYYSLDLSARILMFRKRFTVAVQATDLLKTNKVVIHSWTNGMPQVYDSYPGNRTIRVSMAYRFGNKGKTRKQHESNTEEKNRTN